MARAKREEVARRNMVREGFRGSLGSRKVGVGGVSETVSERERDRVWFWVGVRNLVGKNRRVGPG